MTSDKSPKSPDLRKRTGESVTASTANGDEIERLLRDTYGEVLQQPVPERLLSLLKQIEQEEQDP